MRHLVGFICALALGIAPMVGCSDPEGVGGSGGSAGTGGDSGVGGDGGTGGMPECESPEECDDGNECTADLCTDGGCEAMRVDDGTACAGGECLDGVCAPVSAFPCTEQGIRNAIAEGGGPHFFACDGPTTVVTEAQIVIDNDVILDGEGKLTVDGNAAEHRVFQVATEITAELRGVEVTGGFDGSIHNSGTLTLTNSTVSGNTVTGIYNQGTLTLTNSTVSGNTNNGVVNRGGGTATLTNSTVSGNTAEGVNSIVNVGSGTLTLTNSVVDGDCWGDIASNGYNIESPGDTCGFDQGTDQVDVSADDLKLGPLADNRGPTETHALLPGSVAIDVIPEAACVDADGEPLTEDQRSVTRPQGAMCDVGPFERE